VTDWLDGLGAGETPPTGQILVVGDAPALIARARELADQRGSYVAVAAPNPTPRLFHAGADTAADVPLEPDPIFALMRERGADIVLGPQTPQAAFLLGRLAQRTGGGLVRARDVEIDPDSGRLVCRADAYGGRLLLELAPNPPAFALLDVERLPPAVEDPRRGGAML
jgi:electron transfer flavoprotein alpha subunit